MALSERLLGVEEIEGGFALRYAMDGDFFLGLAEWVTLERQCCSFLTLGLHVLSGEGEVELRLTGSKEVKAFLEVEFVQSPLDELLGRAGAPPDGHAPSAG